MIPGKQPQYWFERHKNLVLATVALLSCILVLVAAELAARIFRPRWAPVRTERVDFWQYDPLLGWSQKPGRQGVMRHIDFSIGISINSQGLRDKEYPVQRTGKKRMLVIGDSYAWGFGVDQNRCFSKLLEADHADWEIINAGVSGYSTDQEFLYLREHGMKFRPDIVLLEFYSNDFEDNNSPEDSWYFKPYFVEENGALVLRNNPVPGATLRQRADRLLYGRTYLLQIIYGTAINAVAKLKSHFYGSAPEETDADLQRKGFNITRRLLGAIRKLCDSQGSRLVIVSVPMSPRNRAFLQDVCLKESIDYLPLDPYFESTGRTTRFRHDRHWNEAGHAIAAKAIGEHLKEIGIF
jgi:hypothetical protein